MPVAHGFVKLWDEAGNSKLQAQFTLPNGSRLHFLGHFNPAVEEFESRDATLTYSNPGALTASHNFYAKIGRGTIFIAIGGDNGPIVEGQLVQPLSPASRVVGFGSWFKNITGDIRSVSLPSCLENLLRIRQLNPKATRGYCGSHSKQPRFTLHAVTRQASSRFLQCSTS